MSKYKSCQKHKHAEKIKGQQKVVEDINTKASIHSIEICAIEGTGIGGGAIEGTGLGGGSHEMRLDL